MKKYEKMLMDILKNQFMTSRGQEVLFEWDDGTILGAEIIGVFKTENFLDRDNPNFEEFQVCSFLIKRIYSAPQNLDSKYIGSIMAGNISQISYHNIPNIIRNNKGDIILDYKNIEDRVI